MIKSGMGLAAILTDVLPILADAAMKQTRLLVKQSAATHSGGRPLYLRTGFVTIHR